jgi:uncharacterized membrane protein
MWMMERLLNGRIGVVTTHPVFAYVFFGLRCLFVVALIVLAVVLIVRALRPRRHGPQETQSPVGAPPSPAVENALRILSERYARGEVDDETYRKMKEEIRKT